MKWEESKKIQEEGFKRRMDIREAKAHDYASEDVLSNFKRMARHVENFGVDVSTADGTALYMVIHKMDRLCNLLYRRQDEPKNESLRDTIDDMKNYIDLMEEILVESKKVI